MVPVIMVLVQKMAVDMAQVVERVQEIVMEQVRKDIQEAAESNYQIQRDG